MTEGADEKPSPVAGMVPVADLLRLADRIESEHADQRFCSCCSTDANHLRDLARRYSATAEDRS